MKHKYNAVRSHNH